MEGNNLETVKNRWNRRRPMMEHRSEFVSCLYNSTRRVDTPIIDRRTTLWNELHADFYLITISDRQPIEESIKCTTNDRNMYIVDRKLFVKLKNLNSVKSTNDFEIIFDGDKLRIRPLSRLGFYSFNKYGKYVLYGR